MTVEGQWQAFSLDALPRLPVESAGWTAALARARSRMPGAVTIAAKGGGEVEIHPDHVTIAPGTAGTHVGFDGMDAFSIERDGQRGWVGIDHRVSSALVHAVLGGPAPLALRPLGRGERGVMAAILFSAFDALGISQRVGLGLGVWDGRADLAFDRIARIAIGGSVRVATGLGGRALLVIPVGWLTDAARTGPVRARLEGLAASATLELARTDLLGAALVSAAAGDAVVFDGVAGIDPNGPWPASLRVGDFVAPACVARDGTFALAGAFSQVEEEAKPMASQDEKSRWNPGEPSASEVAEVLATAPVEVVAEIGRLTVRGDELAGLMKGGVLSLGPRRTEAIQLRVGGQLWAVGELVTMGEELGVRIIRLHAG